MSFIAAAAIGAGGALLGGVIASSGAQSAANAQAEAANRSADLQYKMWQEQQALQSPWRQSGIAAQNKLLTLLGINPNLGATSSGGGVSGGGFGLAGDIAGALNQSGAFGAAPGASSGLNVDTTSHDFGKYGKAFSETNWMQDPGYQFRLSEGLKSLDRTAAARGGLISGGALKAAQRYGQEAASNEYQNAFNRYYNERNQMINPLQSLAGVGQTTSQQLGQAGATMAGNVGEAGMQAANARASGYVGSANALTSALGQGIGAYQQNQMMNTMFPNSYNALASRYGAGNVYMPGGPEYTPPAIWGAGLE